MIALVVLPTILLLLVLHTSIIYAVGVGVLMLAFVERPHGIIAVAFVADVLYYSGVNPEEASLLLRVPLSVWTLILAVVVYGLREQLRKRS
jgi:hypothetical protein